MAQQGFNFQELVRQLGLKNVSELPVVEAITPVIVVGDASLLTSPLRPPAAWAGTDQLQVALENASLQLRVLSPGGVIVKYLQIGNASGAAGAYRSRLTVNLDGVDPFAADPLGTPLTPRNLNPNPVLSRATSGTTTVALGAGFPSFAPRSEIGQNVLAFGFPLPDNAILSLQAVSANTFADFAIMWEEIPVGSSTP